MNQTQSTLPALEVARLACKALDDKKADALCVLDVSEHSSITDFLVLATGNSEPHLRALRVELEKVFDAAKVRILGMDTDQGSGWLVVDAFDVMVHLFTPQTRETYKLETLWKDAVEISAADLISGKQPKPAEKPKKAKKAGKSSLRAAGLKKPAAKKRGKTASKGKKAKTTAARKAPKSKAAPRKKPQK